MAGESNGPIEHILVFFRKPVCRGCTLNLESGERRDSAQGRSNRTGDPYLEPEYASISFEKLTVDFLLLGAGLYVRREPADVIVFRSVILIQHLNLELRVTRHVLDFPEFVPHGLQCVCLDARAASRVEEMMSGQLHWLIGRSEIKYHRRE